MVWVWVKGNAAFAVAVNEYYPAAWNLGALDFPMPFKLFPFHFTALHSIEQAVERLS